MLSTSIQVPSWLQAPSVSPDNLPCQCILASPLPSKVYKHDQQTVLQLAILDGNGARMLPTDLDLRLRLVKQVDMLPVTENILKVGEQSVDEETGTIQIPFRITQVSKNYNNSNFIIVVTQPTSLSLVFEPLYTDAFRVLAKRPDAMTTRPAETGETWWKTPRRNQRHTTPVWVEPWAACAYETLCKYEWGHCLGLYVGPDGRPLAGTPIRSCQECGGFQAQGHVFGCRYKKLLRGFNPTILRNPKVASRRRKKQRTEGPAEL